MKKVIALLGTFGLPFIAFAQQGSLGTVLFKVQAVMNALIPIFITLAVLYFFWGLIQYLKGGVEDHEKGRGMMIWGIITIFVMISVFGLVRFVGQTLSINPEVNPEKIPQVPYSGQNF